MEIKENIIAESASVYINVDLRKSIIGDNSSIGDDSVIINSDISNYVSINRRNQIQDSIVNSFTYTGVNTVIKYAKIGKFCSVSWNVSIGGKNHQLDKPTTHSKWWFYKLHEGVSIKADEYKNSQSCVIGSDVWIASNVIILRGIEIGHGAVIGAGAVVTKDVPPYTVVAGVPAKPMKKRFPDHIIEAMLEIKWWDWPVDVIKANIDLIYNTKVDEGVIEKMQNIKASLTNAD